MKIYSGGPLEIPNESIAQMFRRIVRTHGERVGFEARPGPGQPFESFTWNQVRARVDEIANGLLSSGLAPGDRAAIISDTRMEWGLVDYGILSAAGVTVTVYPTLTHEQMAYLLNDSGSKVVFVEDQTQLDKVASVKGDLKTVDRIVTMGPATAPESVAKMTVSLDELREEGRTFAAANASALQTRIDGQKPDDLATLVYTSGTTGTPKGAVLTNKNFVSANKAAQRLLEVEPNSTTLLFLPLAHCYGRLTMFLLTDVGGRISFSNPRNLVEDLREKRPTLMTSVPRLYERMYDQILKKVRQGPENKQKIFHKAAAVAREYGTAISDGGSAGPILRLKHALFDKLVYSKLRDALGLTSLKIGLTGSAAIRPDLLYFFQGIGVPIYEGYGLTETSAPSNVNLPHKFKPGRVGPPFPGMEMTLADDGEVLMKGPNVFKGYYKLDGETKEAFTDDGWFRTGDIGEFDDDGFLKIVDRKKELEVLNTGKKIAPVVVEEKLKVSEYVAEALLFANDKKFAGCVIQPNFDALVSWADKNGVKYDKSKLVVKPDPTGQPMTYSVGQDLLDNPKVQELYQREVDACNVKCADFERIKVWRLADYAFTIDRDELTATLKKKRRNIVKNYQPLIDAMFS